MQRNITVKISDLFKDIINLLVELDKKDPTISKRIVEILNKHDVRSEWFLEIGDIN